MQTLGESGRRVSLFTRVHCMFTSVKPQGFGIRFHFEASSSSRVPRTSSKATRRKTTEQ